MKNNDYSSKKELNNKNKRIKNIKKQDECEQIITDVLGSYTGTPQNCIEPVQDVDDL